ncbi:MAG: hypothetical protein WCJ80_14700 [Bacteroidota bacterium]
MEVHHPHHPTHKKKWSEYIIEFVMLFIAVTLGFFAENQREHFVEKHREKQYMESLLLDLEKDKMEVEAARKFTNTQIANIDTAIVLITKGIWSKENLKTMYRVSLKTGGNRPISFVESTSTQLKTGGMRLIEDKNITKLITDYWQLLAQMNQAQTNSFDTWKTSIKNMTYKIFDGTNYIDVKNKIINDNAVLMTYDPIYLKEYNNRLLNLKFDLKNYLVDYFYDRIDSTILALQKEIKLKYNITEKIE